MKRTIAIIGCIAILLLAVGPASAQQTTPIENFEDGDISVESPWQGWFGDTSRLSANNSSTISGNFSGLLADDATDTTVFINRSANSTNNTFAFTVKFNTSSPDTHIFIRDNQGNRITYLEFGSDFGDGRSIASHDSASTDTNADIYDGISIPIELRNLNYTSNTYDLYIYGSLVNDGAVMLDSVNGLGEFRIEKRQTSEMRIDDIQFGEYNHTTMANVTSPTLDDFEDGNKTIIPPKWADWGFESGSGSVISDNETMYGNHSLIVESDNYVKTMSLSGEYRPKNFSYTVTLLENTGNVRISTASFGIGPFDPQNQLYLEITDSYIRTIEKDDSGESLSLEEQGDNVSIAVEFRNIDWENETYDLYIDGESRRGISHDFGETGDSGIRQIIIDTNGGARAVIDNIRINGTHYNESVAGDFGTIANASEGNAVIEDELWNRYWHDDVNRLSVVNGKYVINSANADGPSLYSTKMLNNSRFFYDFEVSDASAAEANTHVRLEEDGTTILGLGIQNGNLSYWNGAWHDLEVVAADDTQFRIEYRDMDFQNDTVDIFVNGQLRAVGTDVSFRGDPSGYNEFEVDAFSSGFDIRIDDVESLRCVNGTCDYSVPSPGSLDSDGGGDSIGEGTLTVRLSRWMKHNTSQDVVVMFNRTIVSDQATLTSNNTTLITVSGHKLTATSNVSIDGVALITTEYQGNTVTKNVTVANRTIDNIKIMPEEQFVASALGFDEEDNFLIFGSEIQWILLAILIGSMLSYWAKNEYVGLGVITLLLTLFWINDSVSLGMVFVAYIYSIFAGYFLLDTPSRTNIHADRFQ